MHVTQLRQPTSSGGFTNGITNNELGVTTSRHDSFA
jgi:hypothetical protein